MAAVLGAVLGFEREHRGSRRAYAHAGVAGGRAVRAGTEHGRGRCQALSRVIQGIVAGIGFLGAGTILKGNGKDTSHVKGLTTAAGLWMTAAIIGRWHGPRNRLISTVLALLVLATMPVLVDKFEGKTRINRGRKRAGEH